VGTNHVVWWCCVNFWREHVCGVGTLDTLSICRYVYTWWFGLVGGGLCGLYRLHRLYMCGLTLAFKKIYEILYAIHNCVFFWLPLCKKWLNWTIQLCKITTQTLKTMQELWTQNKHQLPVHNYYFTSEPVIKPPGAVFLDVVMGAMTHKRESKHE